MKKMFNTTDAILSKFEFENFRKEKSIPFNYKYHTHDAALKYWYVLSALEKYKPKNEQYFKILDLGCGNGDMLRIIDATFMAKGVGFDPILRNFNIKIKNLISHPYLINRVSLFSMSHLEFQQLNNKKFDFVIDLCSVTHFDTRKYQNVNYGWKWIADYLPELLKPKGYFITATDISSNSTDREFVKGDDLIDFFKNRNIGHLENCNEIASIEGSKILDQIYKKNNESFYRIGNGLNKKTGKISNILLGVSGLTLRLL